ncbi:MAG: elongation factor P maturation arginine rhamnosyltransferase EarP [Casimicrobium sp.]
MKSVDIFCRVVDNYGDIGVCWRLARQFADEYAMSARLIVDDLGAFRFIAPEVNVDLETQSLARITIVQWGASTTLQPASIVIEAFACDPPQTYVNAMAAMPRKPTWINLEYLSAESWVDGVHGLPSPHPRLPLTKYFFCPGFSAASGGLIRERSVDQSSLPLVLSPEHDDGSKREPTTLFAFTYPHAPVRAVATALDAQVTYASPLTDTDKTWLKSETVPQPEFDALLAGFDVLIVRGEDSFVRAQYAGTPMLWHIYPTADNAHLVKLDAWLDHYCASLDASVATAIRSAHHAFNRGVSGPDTYAAFAANLPVIASHAKRWREHLCAQPDLVTRLLTFISLKEKQKVG